MKKRLTKQAPPTAHTRGPWRWFGNTRNDEIYLAAPWGGRHFVMTFQRWGMSNAQPCFYADGLRHDIGRFVEHERDYRDDVIGIDHPDARLIAAAPELLEACRAFLFADPGEGYSDAERAALVLMRAAVRKADGGAAPTPPEEPR